MPAKLTVAAGIVLLFCANMDSARAFHICGPHNVIRINMFHLQCAPASGTAVRQPCLTRPTHSRAPLLCDVSVRSRRRRMQQGPWRSASCLKMLASTPPSTAALKTESVSSSTTATRKPLSSNRTYSRYTWEPSSIPERLTPTAPSLASTKAESVSPSTATTKPSSPSRTYTRYAWQPPSSGSSGSGKGGEGSALGTSVDPKLDVISQPLPSSLPSTDSDVAPPPVAGGAASAAPGASKAPVALDDNEDMSMRDMESMLKRAKGILTPFLRKIQDNIAEGNLGERGEEWAVAQALILLFVALNSIPVLGGIVLLLTGPGLLVGGVVTSGVGVVQLGESLSPWPAPTKENYLKTDGIFGLVRHPTYCGLIMFCFGLGVTTSSPIRILLATLLAVIIDKKTIKEEEMLVKVHGTVYEDYRNAVAKFVPRYY